MEEKIFFVYSMYDFSGENQIQYDALCSIFRSTAKGLSKICPSELSSSNSTLQDISAVNALTPLRSTLVAESSSLEAFKEHCCCHPIIVSWLKYFSTVKKDSQGTFYGMNDIGFNDKNDNTKSTYEYHVCTALKGREESVSATCFDFDDFYTPSVRAEKVHVEKGVSVIVGSVVAVGGEEVSEMDLKYLKVDNEVLVRKSSDKGDGEEKEHSSKDENKEENGEGEEKVQNKNEEDEGEKEGDDNGNEGQTEEKETEERDVDKDESDDGVIDDDGDDDLSAGDDEVEKEVEPIVKAKLLKTPYPFSVPDVNRFVVFLSLFLSLSLFFFYSFFLSFFLFFHSSSCFFCFFLFLFLSSIFLYVFDCLTVCLFISLIYLIIYLFISFFDYSFV